LLDHNLVYVTE